MTVNAVLPSLSGCYSERRVSISHSSSRAASTNMFTLTASAVHARTHAVPSASTSSPRGAPTRVAHVAPSKSFAGKGRPTRSSHVAKMGTDTGNPFVDGWLDLTDTVSGGGKDLGVSELAEKLGKDVYMDINGWYVSLCPHASQSSPISFGFHRRDRRVSRPE